MIDKAKFDTSVHDENGNYDVNTSKPFTVPVPICTVTTEQFGADGFDVILKVNGVGIKGNTTTLEPGDVVAVIVKPADAPIFTKKEV